VPTANPEWDAGELHATQAPPSRLHWKVDPASLDTKLKVAEVEVVLVGGPLEIVVLGGVVSPLGGALTVQLRVAGVGSVLPAASVARTAKS
jgi:hypothetical protein